MRITVCRISSLLCRLPARIQPRPRARLRSGTSRNRRCAFLARARKGAVTDLTTTQHLGDNGVREELAKGIAIRNASDIAVQTLHRKSSQHVGGEFGRRTCHRHPSAFQFDSRCILYRSTA